MPRKKIAKRSGQRQKSNNALLTVEAMERDFLDAPLQLVTNIDKLIPVLKQKEKQFSLRLRKIQEKIKANNSNINIPKKINNKKKQAQLKKNHQALFQDQTLLTRELKEITFMIEKAIFKKEKWQALGKELKKLEKGWKKPLKVRSKPVQYRSKKTSEEKGPTPQIPLLQEDAVFQSEVSLEATE